MLLCGRGLQSGAQRKGVRVYPGGAAAGIGGGYGRAPKSQAVPNGQKPEKAAADKTGIWNFLRRKTTAGALAGNFPLRIRRSARPRSVVKVWPDRVG